MNTQHTPGPWHIEKSCGVYEIWPKDNGQTHCYIGRVQTKTDAHLIAAAPELLDALSCIAGRCEMVINANPPSIGSPDWATTIAHFSRLAKEARAAIAKAEGQS